ncbi:MAG: hypothetical protein U9Q81_15030 [Pseudomonadota bacterium]|nr:hypothetical protein [Pseudomonadota bacterium]
MSHTQKALPAGYVEIGDVAVHVALVRKHSSNVARFLKWLPAALELEQHEIGSPHWRGVVDTHCKTEQDFDDLTLTLREAAAEQLEIAAEMERFLYTNMDTRE